MISLVEQKTEKMVIKANEPVALGHQSHLSGTGVHQDKRLKRKRTRSAQIRAALDE